MPAQTIFVGSLPASASNERLEEIFSEIGPIKQCFVVREKGTEKCRGFGYVTYSMEEDAQRALKEVKEYDGKRLSLSVAKKKIKDKKKAAAKEPAKEPAAVPEKNEQQSKGFRKKQMKARLIIRNLSFKCSEDDLKEVFSKFGTVLESKIPLKPDGKMRGFAFVMFKNVPQAAKALNTMNLKEIKGRQVAVDWAVPKDKFIATQHSSGAENQNVKVETAKQSDTESDTDDENEKKKQAGPAKKRVTSKAAVQQVEESQSDDEDDNEEEDSDEDEDDDDDDEDEKEEDDDDEEEEDDHDDDDDDDGSSLDSNDDEDESQDDEEDEDDEGDSAQKKKTSKKLLPSDVKEGRTVFIRNLSFDTEDEGLEEVLLQYGELNYIKIVVHPDTEHSKGCAFAQFKTKEAADRCIAAAQDEAENGGIRVDGRKLLIVAAVTREDAAKMKVNKVKVETGTRNMYLAREGLIRAGTKAAEGVSEADMAKRTRFEEIKRAKLRDINVFVSKTRLCVHNLPKSVDNKKLKSLCLQAVKGAKGVRITECRVMYDKKPQKGQVMGQSLGYGFVQFQEHEPALATLRYLNNNPDIFGSHKRPIVEFSLEDSRKLKIKEMRQQKNKEFLQNRPFKGKQHSQTSGDDKGPRKSGSKPQSSLEQMGKQRAPPQNKKKDGNYSGFQTNPEVEHVDLENGKKRRKVLPLPSHRGPKIRMRDKGKQQAPPPKKARPGSKRKEHQKRHLEKPTEPRNQKAAKKHFRSRDGDRFDSLVEQYKKKLMGNSDKNTSIKRSKWFDS
ncbi:LOW QUALITY PROTEIN: RNA-binding protein 28 [Anabas testudineus]|uniref:LOW QUALITY PROTEIN: RNA-binding protein 28 n=1 Tax=Anabas testudineus TaxID=64144 RepID=UPI000E4633C7|nr:LOW QUALITY PROTEIN: RNA-binding protein 28 [Anabas testudineus]